MNDQKQPADEDNSPVNGNGQTGDDDQTAYNGGTGQTDDGASNGGNSQTSGTSQTAGGSQNGDDYLHLKTELEETQTKLQEMTTMTQRALADLQNYRRRSEEEKSSFAQYANAELILDLLPAIDNINRALAHEPKDGEWQKGVAQTLKQLNQILEKRGVKTIPTLDQPFDPKLHEALLTGPGEKDTVLLELEKGYMIGEKVLKRARVKVGDGQSEPPKN